MLSRQSQLFLLHVEGNWCGNHYFMVFYISDRPFFFNCREWIQVGTDAVFIQFTFDDRVIIPEDKSVF